MICWGKAPTLDVEARAFTTPVMSYGDVGASESKDDSGSMDASSTAIPVPLEEPDFDRERRIHHSAPIVHSLS